MIWSLVTEKEMDYGTSPVFRFYREAIGKENIRLAVVDDFDKLEFVKEDDVILLRSESKPLIDEIQKKGLKSTSENYQSYVLVRNKSIVSEMCSKKGILVPKQYKMNEIEDGKRYFVKPCFGSDSFGIDENSICNNKNDVESYVKLLQKKFNYEAVIEDFIEGKDCTVACVAKKGIDEILTYAIEVECDETHGIQTRSCKVGFKEYCSALHDEKLNVIARNVFRELGFKHHARIDFRRDNEGNYYMIDVNLLPGLGPIDHFAKCMLLSGNISYCDAVKLVIESAY